MASVGGIVPCPCHHLFPIMPMSHTGLAQDVWDASYFPCTRLPHYLPTPTFSRLVLYDYLSLTLPFSLLYSRTWRLLIDFSFMYSYLILLYFLLSPNLFSTQSSLSCIISSVLFSLQRDYFQWFLPRVITSILSHYCTQCVEIHHHHYLWLCLTTQPPLPETVFDITVHPFSSETLHYLHQTIGEVRVADSGLILNAILPLIRRW